MTTDAITQTASQNGHNEEPINTGQIIDAPTFSAEAWDDAPSDLRSEPLYVPAVKSHVEVKGLSPGELSDIYQRCTNNKPGAKIPVDVVRINTLKFRTGVVKPRFTEQKVNEIQFKFGPAFNMVIEKIDELTNEDPNSADALARFRAGTGTG